MAARSCGNGTNFEWLRKSCDISTCDLSPDGNPEKYGRPMKSAIVNFYVSYFCLVDVRLKQDTKIYSYRNYLRVETCLSIGWSTSQK